ncbi:MAG TPA: NADP-dependent malic enzyme [Ilumatobacteraceae bacterium]|nr:NADP-dependent malic enzyme [Ilumatobacteraceae bacterium]
MIRDQDVFDYHELPRPGKIEVVASKPCLTQRDLSLAYTPGVARACLAIEDDPDLVNRYTGKGNLVAVVSNGTAVLGLGDIGPLAAKPVMEGKAVLFKRFAGIDVFDLELDVRDPDELITVVAALAPTFGGINLEDIKAPECFYIEEELRRRLDIPVLHDDQHGTAIISAAALVNGLDVVGKRIEDVRVVVSGAGAAGLACAQMFIELGARREHMLVVDSVGVVHEGRRERMNPYKARYASDTDLRTLGDAIRGADVFLGVSGRDVLTPDMLLTMADDPIVLALANPDPEIDYALAVQTRSDVVIATGRSDYPNQVNNVLGFPFIFRGALDVRASAINEAMKQAAVRALAELAREDVPEQVLAAYGISGLRFGRTYLIPKPFDPRVLMRVAPAVARAAMDSGVARRPLDDLGAYEERLERTLGPSREVMQFVVHTAQRRPPSRLVFADGEDDGVLRAVVAVVDQHIARPLLLGRADVIGPRAHELGLHLGDDDVVDVASSALTPGLADRLYELRHLHGMTRVAAETRILDPTIFGLMLVREGRADGFVGGRTGVYPDTIRPAIQLVGLRDGISRVSAVQLLALKDRLVFCADTMVNIDPSAEELAEIAILAADAARLFGIEPRVALLSFSSFGSVRHPLAARVAHAVQLVHEQRPELAVDGEMHVDVAVVEDIAHVNYPHSRIQGDANVFIFPNLAAGNIGYKLVQRLGGAEAIGPILLGIRHPVAVLQPGSTVTDIVNLAAITAVAADLQASSRGHD